MRKRAAYCILECRRQCWYAQCAGAGPKKKCQDTRLLLSIRRTPPTERKWFFIVGSLFKTILIALFDAENFINSCFFDVSYVPQIFSNSSSWLRFHDSIGSRDSLLTFLRMPFETLLLIQWFLLAFEMCSKYFPCIVSHAVPFHFQQFLRHFHFCFALIFRLSSQLRTLTMWYQLSADLWNFEWARNRFGYDANPYPYRWCVCVDSYITFSNGPICILLFRWMYVCAWSCWCYFYLHHAIQSIAENNWPYILIKLNICVVYFHARWSLMMLTHIFNSSLAHSIAQSLSFHFELFAHHHFPFDSLLFGMADVAAVAALVLPSPTSKEFYGDKQWFCHRTYFDYAVSV